MKEVNQLINLSDPGWPIVEEWISMANKPVDVFLWTEGKDISGRSRAIVPIEELWNMNMEYSKKLK